MWGSLGLRPLWCSGGSLFLAVPPPLGMQLPRYGAGPFLKNSISLKKRNYLENLRNYCKTKDMIGSQK